MNQPRSKYQNIFIISIFAGLITAVIFSYNTFSGTYLDLNYCKNDDCTSGSVGEVEVQDYGWPLTVTTVEEQGKITRDDIVNINFGLNWLFFIALYFGSMSLGVKFYENSRN